MLSYAHEKINILFSVLSIFFFLSVFDFNLNTQGFVHLDFVKYQLGTSIDIHIYMRFHKMQCMHICYTINVLYTDMSRLSSNIEINQIYFQF